ncbi:hypothetical protein SLS60_009338 [Paraconiothyrium brasiliense]|uniref:Uncharacterized protein n=1 Tax=Paraconiothyrium brasiliense TaxID=300254 RepID=A0ABR3QUT6_9PLEO
MFTSRIVIAGFIAASTASMIIEEQQFAALLKRQAPGSPEYACHDNCGTAITVSKAGGDYCTEEVFLYDYKNCLQCAGPDNVDIWKYYGGSLSTAAGKCDGLDTEPKSGKQDDVGDAKHPGDSTGASSAASSSTPTSTTETVTEPVSSVAHATNTLEAVTDVLSSSGAEATGTAIESSSAAASLTSAVESAVSFAVSSVLDTAAVVPVPTVSGAPYATGNATTNGTSPTASAPTGQFTGSAETVHMNNVVALIGAVAAVFYQGPDREEDAVEITEEHIKQLENEVLVEASIDGPDTFYYRGFPSYDILADKPDPLAYIHNLPITILRVSSNRFSTPLSREVPKLLDTLQGLLTEDKLYLLKLRNKECLDNIDIPSPYSLKTYIRSDQTAHDQLESITPYFLNRPGKLAGPKDGIDEEDDKVHKTKDWQPGYWIHCVVYRLIWKDQDEEQLLPISGGFIEAFRESIIPAKNSKSNDYSTFGSEQPTYKAQPSNQIKYIQAYSAYDESSSVSSPQRIHLWF